MKKKQTSDFGKKSLGIVQFYFPKVTRVVDADKPVVVEVTQRDVNKSNVKDPKACALALACTRIFHADGVVIGLTTSYIITGKTAMRFKNGESISREIVSFDRKAGFDVGFYHLVPASASNRLDNPRPSGPPRKPNAKSRRLFSHFTSGVRVLRHGVPEIS